MLCMHLQFYFMLENKIVSSLTYTNIVTYLFVPIYSYILYVGVYIK
jgi:hypothetical protein